MDLARWSMCDSRLWNMSGRVVLLTTGFTLPCQKLGMSRGPDNKMGRLADQTSSLRI